MSSSNQAQAAAIGIGMNEMTLGLLGATVLLYGAVLWCARGPNAEKTDFSLTYVGARIVHQGLGSRLYDLDLQKQVRDSLFEHPNPLFFEHPPFEALLLSPLAALPFRTAYMLWGFLNATVWLLLIFFMRPHLPAPREDLGYMALWLLFAPLGVALYQGQSSLLLLALYAAAFVLLRDNHEFAAGALLGIGLFKFQFVLPFALIFFFCKRWRFLSGFCLIALLLGVLSLLATGWHGVVSYAKFLLAIGTTPQNLSYGSAVDMPTIHGFVYAIVGRRISHLGLSISVLALSVALLLFIARHWKTSHGSSEDNLMFAAAVAGSLLSGFHMFTHDFSPLMLAIFIALANLPPQSHSSLRVAMIFTLVVFWLPPVYFVLVALHGMYLMCPILLVFAITTVLSTKYVGQALSRESNYPEVTRA
jgi:Glycosyltransferase family 87